MRRAAWLRFAGKGDAPERESELPISRPSPLSGRWADGMSYLWLLIGCWLVWRYAWVLDDAFIYFRYADNAAILNAGLVYNQAEFVEGYSSPLWMLLLVGLRSLGFAYWEPLIVLGCGALILTWMLARRTNRQLGAGLGSVDFPAVFLCTAYAVQSHFTSGLETPLVQLQAVLFVALILNPDSRLLQAAFGLAPLVRPELNLPFVVALAWCAYKNRQLPWMLLIVGIGSQSAWLAFRIVYYAALVPNTFHLKDEINLERGLYYLHDTLRSYYLYYIIAGFSGMSCWLWLGTQRARLQIMPRAVMWLGALLVTGYVIKIGGDFVHYRYLAFPVCVLVCSFGGLFEIFVERWRGMPPWAIASLSLVLGSLLLTSYPRQLSRHPLTVGPNWDLTRYQLKGIEDAASHRSRPDLDPASWDGRASDIPRHLVDDGYRMGMATGWCILGYRALDTYVMHELGLTEFALSRVSAKTDHAGHRWIVAPLVRDLLRMRVMPRDRRQPWSEPMRIQRATGQGIFLQAVIEGRAAPWIQRNVRILEELGRRAYNNHRLTENLSLAFTRVPPLALGGRDLMLASWADRASHAGQ